MCVLNFQPSRRGAGRTYSDALQRQRAAYLRLRAAPSLTGASAEGAGVGRRQAVLGVGAAVGTSAADGGRGAIRAGADAQLGDGAAAVVAGASAGVGSTAGLGRREALPVRHGAAVLTSGAGGSGIGIGNGNRLDVGVRVIVVVAVLIRSEKVGRIATVIKHQHRPLTPGYVLDLATLVDNRAVVDMTWGQIPVVTVGTKCMAAILIVVSTTSPFHIMK